ncbi:MAG: hypothetical protein M1827_005841 [Pycnora praestabilis]|nr:MAG: hypothetical protein M1827_005841 [Pycnora praestabilis]
MPATTSEADIIFNKANVALAKSRRLIASWLPPPTAEEVANAKTEEELEREEAEIFAPVPELLGLGAPIPKGTVDGSANRKELTSNETLRRQLLGKKRALAMRKRAQGLGKQDVDTHRPVTKLSRPNSATAGDGDEDEEEGGRSSLGKSKRRREELVETQNVEAEVEAKEMVENALPRKHKVRKRSGNFLDEMLAEKSLKKKKRRKGNKGPSAEQFHP